jgi:hypothetical protein
VLGTQQKNEWVPEDAGALILTLELLRRHPLGRKRIADSLVAACLLRANVNEIITCNAADFSVFEGLRTLDPRSRPSPA